MAADGEVDPSVQEGLRSLLAFDASADFFDVHRCLRDRITGFEGTTPIIDVTDFTANESIRIALQQSLEALFEEKYRVHTPSRWGENERLLRSLYEYAHMIASSFPGRKIVGDDGEDDTAAAKRDLATLIMRMGLFNLEVSKAVEIRGTTIQVNSYEYSGRLTGPVPTHIGFRSEIETRFLSEYDRLRAVVSSLRDVDRMINGQTGLGDQGTYLRPQDIRLLLGAGIDLNDVVATATPIVQGLTRQRPPQSFSRDDVEKASGEIDAARAALEAQAYSAVAKFLDDATIEDVGVVDVDSGTSAWGLADALTNADIQYRVVEDIVRGRALLVCGPTAPGLLKGIKDPIRAWSSVARLLVVGTPQTDLPKIQHLRGFDLWEEPESIRRALEPHVKWLLDAR
jgi:hypothetical protein